MTKATKFPVSAENFLILFTVIIFLFVVVTVKRIQTDTIGLLKTNYASESCFLDINYIESNLHNLEQNDSRLIQYIRIKHLTPPSILPYNLRGKGNTPSEYWKRFSIFFDNGYKGRFIEAGANDGEAQSKTLYMEKYEGWEGLLVECNPILHPKLKWKHRKAWVADVCLSPTNHVATLNFSNPVNWSFSGTLGKPWTLPPSVNSREWTQFDVRAVPLYTILAAIGWTEVDFFVFDIEGQELNVLRNFPFDKVTFKLLIVEVQFDNETDLEEMENLMDSNGYAFVEKYRGDHIYVPKQLQHKMVLPQ